MHDGYGNTYNRGGEWNGMVGKEPLGLNDRRLIDIGIRAIERYHGKRTVIDLDGIQIRPIVLAMNLSHGERCASRNNRPAHCGCGR